MPQRARKQIQPTSGPEKAFGQMLREIRHERGISQEELAFQCNFDRTFISLLERGVRSPTLRTIMRLGEQLSIKPSKLIQRMETVLAKQTKPARKPRR